MKELHHLTDLQLEIMNVLWTRGEATVAEVHEALLARTGLARKTIGTLLFRLEKQGVLMHREEGREYVYRPRVARDEVERATVGNLLSRLFRGDVTAMVSHALEAEEVDEGDIERIRTLLERWEAEQEES
ncbi:MAG TPA: BlaI/MecI/CopY family transcriptional regulator [Longimicrobiaceae bacterium]|nr:BlaI/MecI/CopY family transcriptional regulator [Longimicrobiaceae bacterium]